MKERPILFSGPMVRAILEGRKTQTRRILDPQPNNPEICGNVSPIWGQGVPQCRPDTYCVHAAFNQSGKRVDKWLPCPYGQPGDRLYGDAEDHQRVYISEHGNTTQQRRKIASDSDSPERRLHGGGRRPDLLQDSVCGVREKNPNRLVSLDGAPNQEGLSVHQHEPRKQEGDRKCSSVDLLGFPRGAEQEDDAGAAFGREPGEQCPGKPGLGQPARKLDGPESPRAICDRREAPLCEVDGLGAATFGLGAGQGALQPEARSQNLGHVPELHSKNRREGDRLWVKETYAFERSYDAIKPSDVSHASRIAYPADGPLPEWAGRLRPSIHMPRWASRINLEVTGVRVERLQDISDPDILAEGVTKELMADILGHRAGTLKVLPEHWISGADESESYCREHALAKMAVLAKEHPEEDYRLDGGFGIEGDSPATCEKCGVRLSNTLTQYGCEAELDHFRHFGFDPNHPDDCYSFLEVLASDGWEGKHAAAIHRLAWRALFTSINGPEAWDLNPWVWAINFERRE